LAYPEIAAGLDDPSRKLSPLTRSVGQAGVLVGAMMASRLSAARVSSIAFRAVVVAFALAAMYSGSVSGPRAWACSKIS